MTRVVVPAPLEGEAPTFELLPFRFHRLDSSSILVTNLVGEHLVLSWEEFGQLADLRITDAALAGRLRGRHFIRQPDETLPLELLAMKTFTRQRHLSEFTRLHIFVVTLRCEHSCSYCQVSRRNAGDSEFDMSAETAVRAMETAFRSPAKHLKIEFQGGEPLLRVDLIEAMVGHARLLAERTTKSVSFVIATNLVLLDEDILRFAEANDVYFSTSLDGPAHVHNANRPRPGGDSWQRAVAGIRQFRRRSVPTGLMP